MSSLLTISSTFGCLPSIKKLKIYTDCLQNEDYRDKKGIFEISNCNLNPCDAQSNK